MKRKPPYLFKEVPLNDLEGKIIKKIKDENEHEIVFYTSNNERYVLKNDDYKNVDIMGDLDDLIDMPVNSFGEISYLPEYGDLLRKLRISTIASCVNIKYYADLDEVKAEIQEND